MKAIVIDCYGGNEVVHLRDVPLPEVGRGEVLIRVRGASINPVDWKIRDGMVRILTGWRFPKVLGSECAGEIVKTGPGVRRFKNGDQVIGAPGIRRLGAFAEYASVAEGKTFRKPASLPFEEAATLPIAGLTALQALRDKGRIKAGSRVLVNGASGGVGTFAVQVARVFGAEVTAVCSGANHELVRELGAERVIDYTREDFTREGERYDLIFDAVATSSFAADKKALAPQGVYVATLPSPAILLNQFLTGFVTGRQARTLMVKPNEADMAWMRERIEAGVIRVVVDRVVPLERIGEAFAYSESGKARGKVVVKVEQDSP
jgi:NADPH:quinone reductase-like Zn-dependent oxidoreductase